MRAEHVEIDEAKSVFEANYSHVYFILYDTFVQAETNLRQRGKFAAIDSRWQIHISNGKCPLDVDAQIIVHHEII